jgi:hypothetical protein
MVYNASLYKAKYTFGSNVMKMKRNKFGVRMTGTIFRQQMCSMEGLFYPFV